MKILIIYQYPIKGIESLFEKSVNLNNGKYPIKGIESRRHEFLLIDILLGYPIKGIERLIIWGIIGVLALCIP